MQAIDGSLARLDMEYVDLIFCHRPDPNTPIEETVFAMSDIIRQGKALYWGTSEWSADEIRAAWEIAERHHLHKPQMEQPQYNMLHRDRVEKEYARLYGDIGLGLTIWSPLASGLLTGKYNDGIPADSRASCARLRMAEVAPDRPECPEDRAGAPTGGRRSRLHDVATGDRLDSQEPACQHRDHRRQPRITSTRKYAGAGSRAQAHG
jgi:aryl-alcohol dehydrogenase-like predicted oxidoreductase